MPQFAARLRKDYSSAQQSLVLYFFNCGLFFGMRLMKGVQDERGEI